MMTRIIMVIMCVIIAIVQGTILVLWLTSTQTEQMINEEVGSAFLGRCRQVKSLQVGVVRRDLQFAASSPDGCTYICGSFDSDIEVFDSGMVLKQTIVPNAGTTIATLRRMVALNNDTIAFIYYDIDSKEYGLSIYHRQNPSELFIQTLALPFKDIGNSPFEAFSKNLMFLDNSGYKELFCYDNEKVSLLTLSNALTPTFIDWRPISNVPQNSFVITYAQRIDDGLVYVRFNIKSGGRQKQFGLYSRNESQEWECSFDDCVHETIPGRNIVAYSPKTKLLVSVDIDKDVILWKVTGNKTVSRVKTFTNISPSFGAALDIDGAGNILVMGINTAYYYSSLTQYETFQTIMFGTEELDVDHISTGSINVVWDKTTVFLTATLADRRDNSKTLTVTLTGECDDEGCIDMCKPSLL
jgi:hypothetical protein